MGSIRVADQRFYVDDQPTFIFGGEFHYFRVDPEHWSAILDQMKAAGVNLISSYVPWICHEDIEGQIDFTGARDGRRDLRRFLELVADRGFSCLLRPGPYVMSELDNEGLPNWLYQTHPDVLARTVDGTPHPTRAVSYLNPEFLSLVDRWYAAFINVTRRFYADRGGPINMLQLDNEVGMLQWVTNNADYSTDALQRFLARYPQPDIADAVELLRVFRDPADPRNTAALFNSFVESFRYQFADYLSRLRQPFLAAGIEIPLIVNVHGFHQEEYAKRATMYPIGLSQLAQTVDIPNSVLAGDYYIGNIIWENYTDVILANLITASLQRPAQPLFSAEFQSGFQTARWRLWPSTIDMKSKLCFAYGMNAINYYMFVGGFNPPQTAYQGAHHDWQAPIGADCTCRPSYHTLADLAGTLRALGPQFLDSAYDAPVAFGLDLNYYRTEYTNTATAGIAATLRADRDTVIFDGIVASFLRRNHNMVGVDLRTGGIDPRRFPHAVIFASDYMDPRVQQRVVDYLGSGGTALVTPKIPTMDLAGRACTILRDALGITEIRPNAVRFFDTNTVRCAGLRTMATQAYTVSGSTPFAVGAAQWEDPDAVVGFYRPVGAGRVAVLGAALSFDHLYKHAITDEIAGALGMVAQVEFEDGIELEAAVRVAPTGARYTFLSTYLDYPQTTTVRSAGQLRFGGHPITLVPRESLVLVEQAEVAGIPVAWATGEFRLRDGEVTLHGSTPVLHVATKVALQFAAPATVTSEDGVNVYQVSNPGRPVEVRPAG